MKNIDEIIFGRKSPRSFSEKELSEELLLKILDAARWAPSSMNEQPWLYMYALRGSENFNKILDALVPFNIQWAKNASALLVSFARKNSSYNNQPNKYYAYDTGSANQNLLLYAFSYDVYGHVMGGFNPEVIVKEFNVPADIEPICVIALGYLDSPDKLPEDLKKREVAERVRKPLNEIIIDKF